MLDVDGPGAYPHGNVGGMVGVKFRMKLSRYEYRVLEVFNQDNLG